MPFDKAISRWTDHWEAAEGGFQDRSFGTKKINLTCLSDVFLTPNHPSFPQHFKRSCIRDTGFFGKDFLLSNGLENEDFLSPCLVLFLKGLLRNFSCLSEGLFGPFFDELFGPIGSFLPIRAKHPSFMTYKRRRVPEVRQ